MILSDFKVCISRSLWINSFPKKNEVTNKVSPFADTNINMKLFNIKPYCSAPIKSVKVEVSSTHHLAERHVRCAI